MVCCHKPDIVIKKQRGPRVNPAPLLSLAIFAPAVAKVYIVSFRSHNDDRPSRLIGADYERLPPLALP